MRVRKLSKYLRRGQNRKVGGIKRGGGKLGQGAGALKKRGGMEPLYEVCMYSLAICSGFTGAGLH